MSGYIQLYKDVEVKQIVYPYAEIEAVNGLIDKIQQIGTKDVQIICSKDIAVNKINMTYYNALTVKIKEVLLKMELQLLPRVLLVQYIQNKNLY